MFWGTTGGVLELVGPNSRAVPLVVGSVRMLVAAPLLAFAARLTGESLRPASLGFLPAGLCIAAYQLCYFSAVPLVGVAATAVLAICSAPLLVAVLATTLLHEPLERSQLAAVGLGVPGAGLLVGGGLAGSGSGFVLGSALALGAGLAYSLYIVSTKRALASSSPLGLAGLTFTSAAVALLPVLAVDPAATAATVVGHWPLLAYLGALPTAAAYWLYTRGLHRVPAGSAAVVGLLEPLTATLLGLIAFHEPLGPARAAGVLLLLAAMGLLALGRAAGASLGIR